MNPPAVANQHANNLLNDATNGHAPDRRTQAGKAAKCFKKSTELYLNSLVTTPEYGSQLIFAMERLGLGLGLGLGFKGWKKNFVN